MDNCNLIIDIEDFTGDFASIIGYKKTFYVSTDKKNTLEFMSSLLENNSNPTKKLNPFDYKLLVNLRFLPTNETTPIDFDEIKKCACIRLFKNKHKNYS